ncbi:HEAT repeat domain-containing protein [Rhizobium sp. DKSPLA3]|uniref:HEAT repeat domain-containing protein n=1 Tax=Rhizobium quercicola TaxID=2901226 RepID=A0A9X1SZ80_9HYPH|nr:HEAT repeat domain-containing protein [Rhizobium quercicola]MCD7108041.1 HEAT repeat domain-containing protein [Rhizobium quercicola]
MPIMKPKTRDLAETDAPLNGQRPFAELVDALASRDHATRLSAIRSLGTQGGAPAIDVLCRHLIADDDRATRDVIAVELARLGGEAVVEGLMPLLRSDDAALRNIAIDILKELPTDVAPRMEALLDDPDPDVRIFLVNVLEALRHPAVEDWLVAVITMDANVNVVGTALDLLNEVGSAACVPALRAAIARFPDEPFVTFSAENALRRIGSAS